MQALKKIDYANVPSNQEPLLILLIEWQFWHLQAHLSPWLPDLSRFTILMLIAHLLQTIAVLAKRWRACSQDIVFILPSADRDESVKIYSDSADRLIGFLLL